jgi:hypothetical protein
LVEKVAVPSLGFEPSKEKEKAKEKSDKLNNNKSE